MKTIARSGHSHPQKAFISALGIVLGLLLAAQADATVSPPSSGTCATAGVRFQFQNYFERLERKKTGNYKEVQDVIFLDSLKINESKKVSIYMQDAFINNIFLGPIDVYAARTFEEPERIKNFVLVVFNNGCVLLDVFELESFR